MMIHIIPLSLPPPLPPPLLMFFSHFAGGNFQVLSLLMQTGWPYALLCGSLVPCFGVITMESKTTYESWDDPPAGGGCRCHEDSRTNG